MTYEQINKRREEIQGILEETLRKENLCVDRNNVNDVWIGIDIRPQKSKKALSFIQSKYTGKWSIIIGDFGNKKRFPQKKDGSFSWNKIAEEIKYRLDVEKARQEHKEKIINNNKLVQELKEAYDVHKWDSILEIKETGDFRFKVDNEDLGKLAILLSVAKQLGLVKTKD